MLKASGIGAPIMEALLMNIRFLIPQRIRELREAAGLSTNALARRAGIPQSSLSEIESGKYTPRLEKIEAICAALGITLADFFAPAGEGAEPLSPELRRLLESAEKLSADELEALQVFLTKITARRK
jgi:transcriptional regulator with XRE-family HTH domain